MLRIITFTILTYLPPLQSDDAIVTDDSVKADMFNKYSYSLFTNEDITNSKMLENSSTYLCLIIKPVSFTPKEVYYELVNFDVSKACGLDHITPKLLKLSADFISGPLSQLFNQSMSSGTLPKDWTTANIVPIHKKGEHCLVKNYRPISLTSIVVKVMEKVICNQFWKRLDVSVTINLVSMQIVLQLPSYCLLYMIGVHVWNVVVPLIVCSWTSPRHLTLCHMNIFC